jgi:hypothetical protein
MNLGQADVLVDRHDLRPQLVAGRVQRDGEVIPRIQLAQAVKLLGQADRADRDPPVADSQAIVGAGFVEAPAAGCRGSPAVRPCPSRRCGSAARRPAAAAARSSICSTISPLVRLRSTPSRPLAQKTQPIAQPTCVLMQMLRRSPSRKSTHSICPPSARRQQQFLRAVGRPLEVPYDACWSKAENLPASSLRSALGRVAHRLEALGPPL